MDIKKQHVPVIDAHLDLGVYIRRERKQGRRQVLKEDYLEDMRRGGIEAVIAAIYVDPENDWGSCLLYTSDLGNANMPPSAQHWFGTDQLGRDILVRVLYGARISLTVGFAAAFINLVIGTLYGGIAGYVGGRVDLVMMRIVEIIYAVPTLLYVILIMMFMGASLFSVIFAIAVSSWAAMARIVRSQVLTLKEQEFAMAARVIGASRKRILVKHLILNAMGPILVTLTLNIPQAIFNEAFLSFVGVGISVPMASWGTLANEALPTIFTDPYQLFFPVGAICLTMFSLNFIGDGLSDAFDPKRKQ